MNTYFFIKILITSIGIILAITGIIFLLININRKKIIDKKKLKKLIALIVLSIWVLCFDNELLNRIAYNQFYFSRSLWIDGSVIVGIVSFVQVVLPLSTCIYLFYYGYFKKNNEHSPTDSSKELLEKFFADERFHTAFSTSLPKGEKDEKYGIDYIPFMLQEIQNKRKRFKVYSDRFLISTLTLGGFFIAIVIFFGYILLNDSSIGVSKNISELKSQLSIANINSTRLNNSDIEEELLSTGKVSIYNLKNRIVNSGGIPGISLLFSSILAFQANKNFDSLLIKSKIARDSLLNASTDLTLTEAVSSFYTSLENFSTSKNFRNAQYASAIKELNSIFPKIQEEIEKPGNQLNEIIKRLILSIIIISFFLVILRYVAKLYLDNHRLMIQAENEDINIRKFYVALKNTDKNNIERKIVIESLLNKEKNDETEPNSALNLSKEESGILKDFLNSLMKKL